jgi:malonyl-CoA/methylmalonyl-CoA synthetase
MHGLLNKLLCVLNVGGCVEFSHSASPNVIWQRLAADQNTEDALTIFMAVPTVYAKMLEYALTMDEETKEKAVNTMKKMRLMACGSAALPDVVMDNWKKLTGQTLLERYGMTEVGMALSNPYQGERRKGHVGFPLPFVKCRIVDENSNIIDKANSPGELQIAVSYCLFCNVVTMTITCLLNC